MSFSITQFENIWIDFDANINEMPCKQLEFKCQNKFEFKIFVTIFS